MNLSHKSLSALGLGLALTVTLSARAQMSGDGTPPAPTTATSSDMPTDPAPPANANDDAMEGKITHGEKSFILAVAEGSNQEVALSELAVTNASSQDVKDFAQMMLKDHAVINAQLAELAASKGVDISAAVAKGQKKGVKSLGKKQGADFDKAYLKDMVSGHDATLKAFKKEAEKAKDLDVRNFASNNVGTIQMHDDRAHSLAQAAM
jgi:putative membrane protein